MNTPVGSARSRWRVVVASLATAVLVLGVAGPTVAQEQPTGTGASSVTIVPGTLGITGLPVDVDTSLGALVADATNVADPVARLALENVGAAGQTAPPFAVSSADGNQRGNEQRSVGAAGVGASVGLVEYLVEAGADRAVADLGALAAEVTTPVGLGASLDSQGLGAVASATETTSGVVVELTGLELGLDDLLPADVLEALPLSVLLDLIDGLGLPVPADLADQLDDLDALLTTLHGAVDQAGTLSDLQDQIDTLVADLPAVTEAQQDLEDALAALAAAEAELALVTSEIEDLLALSLLSPLQQAELDDLLAEQEALESQIETLEADVADAQAALDAALAAAAEADAELQDLLDQLAVVEDTLDGLLADLDDLLAGLDLQDLLDDLLGLIGDTPLLSLGNVGLVLDTAADAAGGTGTVACSAGGLEVLGEAVPTPDCAAVGDALDTLSATIGDVLALLPVAGALPEVSTGGLQTTSSGDTEPDADGVSEAFAQVTALTVDIAPVELTGVVDDLVGELDGLVGELDALVPGLTVPDLTGASAAAVTVPTGLDAALGELDATLGQLPTGAALDGLDTVGLNAALGAIGLESTFAPTTATPAAPTDPAGPATPGSPDSPAGPSSPNLPNTGLDLHTLFMAAIAALMAGAVTASLGRPRTVELLQATRRGSGLHR